MFLLLLFIALLSLLFSLLIRKHTKNGASNPPILRPPGPKGLPLIGNLHQFDPLTTHLYFSQLSKTYGPLVYLQLGCVPILVVSSTTLAKEVLKTQDHNFCSRPPLTSHKKLSYNGLDVIFSPYNQNWRELRKICITHLFSSKRVQAFSSIREEEVVRMMKEICSLASGSKLVNVDELVMSFSIFIIRKIAFGKSYGNDENSKAKTSRFHCILNQAQDMFMSLFWSDYFPCMSWVDKVTGASRRLENVYMELDEFYQELIDEHLDPNWERSEQEDIIDVLLQLRKEHGTTVDLTLDHIKAVLMNIFIAGTETTATVLVWTMTELMKNPNVMYKVQEELRTFVKEQNVSTFIQEEDLHHFVYLKAVVKETFRFHPVVPLLVPHQTLQNCTLEGYQIKPGTVVYVNVWAIGRDQESWDDPENFIPERFLDSSIDFKGHDFELIPFGAGRRICPGMLMGVVTIELALANMLCWFEWELPDGMKREDIDMDVLPGLSINRKNALCLSAKNFTLPQM